MQDESQTMSLHFHLQEVQPAIFLGSKLGAVSIVVVMLIARLLRHPSISQTMVVSHDSQ